MTTTDRDINERLDHLGIVAGVCQEIGLAAPTGYATSERRGGESPENLAKTAEMWLPERKLYLCRCWKEWKQGVSYGTVILRWEKEGCYRIPFKEQAPQTYPLLGTML